MHDIVAHSLAVIITMAEAAAAKRRSDPERAGAAMEQVAETGWQALGLAGMRERPRFTAVPSSPGLAPAAAGESAPASAPRRGHCRSPRHERACGNEAPGTPALDQLTSRERQVLIHVAEGLTNSEIAAAMFLSEATVKSHLGRVLAKLDLRDRVQAVILAYETGLVHPRRP
jgi:DNA-binding NarL/FixJ family response regulator